jgi:hypothetical protein
MRHGYEIPINIAANLTRDKTGLQSEADAEISF